MKLSFVAVMVGLATASCGVVAPAAAPGPDAGPVATFQTGLRYDGSIAIERSGAGPAALSAAVQHVEISAPIIPDVSVLYLHEGAAFPVTAADEASLADAAALDFEQLLVECAGYADYSAIVIVGPSDPPLSQAQLATNYELVAECAYVHHSAKPYWIPKLVDDVDICGRTLGVDWRLLAAADLAGFATADFQFLADTLAGVGSGGALGAMYFSLRAYARDGGGSLVQAHLEPSAPVRSEPLPVAASTTSHLEGDFGLRCIRQVP